MAAITAAEANQEKAFAKWAGSCAVIIWRIAGPARWLALWLVLFAFNGILVPYFDNGPPDSWPGVLKVATGIFLAPGVLFWLVLFWHPFGGGPTGSESMFIIFVNATVWLAVSYVTIWILGWLRGRRRGL